MKKPMTDTPDTRPRLFVTMSSYVAGRLLGVKQGERYLKQLMTQPDSAEVKNMFPAVRSIWRLKELAPQLALCVDTGATNIAKSLSRHFHKALNSDCAAWIHFDDDGECSSEVLAWLLNAVDFGLLQTTPRVCGAPYIHRNEPGDLVLVEWSPIYAERNVGTEQFPGGKVRPAKRTGFGTVITNRAALNAIAEHNSGDKFWRDDDGEWKIPLFHQILDVTNGKWHGPDFTYFQRLPPSVVVEALITGETVHAGYELNLGESDQYRTL